MSTERVWMARRALFAVILLLGAVPAVLASDVPVPDSRRSPRATMRTFLEAVVHGGETGSDVRLDDAVACVDLSAYPGLGRTEQRQLVVDLKEIIDRTRFVVYEEIPGEEDGPPWVFLRETAGEIVIGRLGAGDWRFTQRTVESIPALLRSAANRERVEGAADAPGFLSPAAWLRARIPPPLREVGFLLEHWQWLGMLVLAFTGVIADWLVVVLLVAGTGHLATRLIPKAEKGLTRRTARPVGLLVGAIVWRLGIPWLGLPPAALSLVLVAVTFVLAVAAVWVAYRFIDVFSEYLGERAAQTATRYDDLLIPLIRKSLKIIVIAFGLVFIADNLNVNITSLVAGLGLGGLAFALAAQDVVKNLFGSITVLMDRPFHVGDWVAVEGIEGTVEEVGFRSTRIRTSYDSLVALPNAGLLSSPVDNYGARRYRRWRTMLALTYDTPPEKLEAFCEGVRELIRRHPHTWKDSIQVYGHEFGAASLDVWVNLFFQVPGRDEELRERHRLFLDILRLAERLGVEFAFPTQTLHVLRPGELPDHGVQPAPPEALELGRRAAESIVGEGGDK